MRPAYSHTGMGVAEWFGYFRSRAKHEDTGSSPIPGQHEDTMDGALVPGYDEMGHPLGHVS